MKMPSMFKRIRRDNNPGNSPVHHNPIPNRELSAIFWSITAILLSFLCLMHLGVLVCFVFKAAVSPFVAPAALLIALAIGYWLAGREGLRSIPQILPLAIAIAVVAISMLLAALFFDMSWDGLWYHQTAVYQMAHGWNPLYEPMRGFTVHLQDWLRHYAKGPWYISLALFQITHDIEWSKAAPWMMLAVTFFAVLAACIDFEMSRGKSAVIAALVALSPVVTCPLATYLVDGLLASYMACFVAATFSYFKRRSPLIVCVIASTAILCINVKFTGLVYLCFISAAAGLYAIIKRRDVLLNYAVVQIVPYLLGIFLFGYNPYVTNYVHRGHPFYPLMGTAAYPSHDQQGRDPVELYETPKNMMGRNALYRHFYAIFGRPYNIYDGTDVRLMWPFDIRWKDVDFFCYHELRIGGFGPLFSGALIISLVLLAIAMFQPGIPRGIILLFIGTIIVSLMISRHTWWARFEPQVWWLPIAAVIAGLAIPGWRAARWAAGGLAAILLINVILVAVVHFYWEIIVTRTTYEQLAFLKDKGDVEIDFAFFREPYSERLKAGGVTFHATHNLQGKNIMELMSVMPGNPMPVRARIKED
jgi:hypothetical protein